MNYVFELCLKPVRDELFVNFLTVSGAVVGNVKEALVLLFQEVEGLQGALDSFLPAPL
jgi:hypothetical protein